ncbi:type ISP restriction/modification enzyme [Pseudanabaena mucicola]|uniref:type ISP restriction/modification enzyme n=1 Tax=Pseudanabaena mucicola TaxID=71190 RepID=UPI002574FD1E|nr:type ISP restriction/modification enzyme [Pseudanabaena mucicola]
MAKIYHAHLWGSRQTKYSYLLENDVNTVEWKKISPNSPFYLFIPQSENFREEYEQGWQLTSIFGFQSMGITSGDDEFLYDFSVSDLKRKINIELENSNLIHTDKSLSKMKRWVGKIVDKDWKMAQYRPFDQRAILYCHHVLERARTNLNQQFQLPNLGLITIRRTRENINSQFFVTDLIADKSIVSSADNANIFPLYLHPDLDHQQGSLLEEPPTNLSPEFLAVLGSKLGYIPTPEEIFYYIYAIFHSPTYRSRYAEFLKIDFPRVPLTSNKQLFQNLCEKGQALVDLHLMKSKKLNKLITKMGGKGDNAVTEVTYKTIEKQIYINKDQYFEKIEKEVWEFKIGGYQVLDKWLKDRKKAKRNLSFDDILHYQKVVVALRETMEIMQEIDRIIPSFPIE